MTQSVLNEKEVHVHYVHSLESPAAHLVDQAQGLLIRQQVQTCTSINSSKQIKDIR